MKILKRNEKFIAFSLLALLFIYACVLVILFGQNDTLVLSSNDSRQSTFVSDLEFRQITDLQDFEIAQEENNFVVDEGDVQGWWRRFVMGRCNALMGIEKPQLFCDGSGGSSEGNLRIVEIFAPDILFLGAAAPEDNLVLTTNTPGRIAFWNASEIISPTLWLRNMSPLEEYQEEVLYGKSIGKDIFDMHYRTYGRTGEVEFDVYPGEQSLCPHSVNEGIFNVKASNRKQEDLTGMWSSPSVVEGLGDRNSSANICREGAPTIDLNEDESFLLCSEGFWRFPGCDVIRTLKEGECEGMMGVVIDAPLGSGEVCGEEDCSIRSLEAARLLTAPPHEAQKIIVDGDSGDYIIDDPWLLTTPCKVKRGCDICLTKCIWDISIWLHHFALEEYSTYPGHRNKMTRQEYMRGVEDEIKIRARIETRRW